MNVHLFFLKSWNHNGKYPRNNSCDYFLYKANLHPQSDYINARITLLSQHYFG
ncbi:hypothetical protein HMP0015_1546 [Acinetobacter haemolyticus ATCC 19194]|uniref:Uncharacterized protein n=1 Tax=Acinetobacter haemolyticus ATCC 19194 TaxID=707232 RepID=D4XPA4_ACIHA|nr:hypothetical protein HMPREF0023_1462 [Acinetobacter sp. ATCC 27244]EFF82985.1 hypothetical protein HMP0015_1546 [Acinetobacter haemolyticus ATCC 19194]